MARRMLNGELGATTLDDENGSAPVDSSPQVTAPAPEPEKIPPVEAPAPTDEACENETDDDRFLKVLLLLDMAQKNEPAFFTWLEQKTQDLTNWAQNTTQDAANAVDRLIDHAPVPESLRRQLKDHVNRGAAAAIRAEGNVGQGAINAEHHAGRAVLKVENAIGAVPMPAAANSADMRATLDMIISLESRGRNVMAAQNGTMKTTCGGILQFSEKTWLGMVKKYGAQFGMGEWASHIHESRGRYTVDPGWRQTILDGRFDPRKAISMEIALVQEADNTLRSHGLPINARNRYMIHFAGPGDGPKLIAASMNDPNSLAVDHVGARSAASNHSMFYVDDRGRGVQHGGRAVTTAQFMNAINVRIAQGQQLIARNGSYVDHFGGPQHPAPTQLASADHQPHVRG